MNNNKKNADHFIFKKRFAVSVLLTGITLALTGCATIKTAEQSQQALTINKTDPYENFNRKVFVFNNAVDNYVAEPISNAYKWITPQFMQTGVFNFFNNLKNVNVVINDVLQAKFTQGAEDTGRFAINSTLGLAGLFDIAKQVGLEQNEEDFDQTLAVWGVPQGSYLVLPFLGPSTARGIPGAVFDTAANPASYVGMPVQLVSMLNTRASAEGALKFIDEAALDPYVFTRESFLQWRNSLASDGKSEPSADMDILNEESTSNSPVNTQNKTKENSKTSFVNAALTFDKTAKSFESAAEKLDQFQAKKFKRVSRLNH